MTPEQINQLRRRFHIAAVCVAAATLAAVLAAHWFRVPPAPACLLWALGAFAGWWWRGAYTIWKNWRRL